MGILVLGQVGGWDECSWMLKTSRFLYLYSWYLHMYRKAKSLPVLLKKWYQDTAEKHNLQ